MKKLLLAAAALLLLGACHRNAGNTPAATGIDYSQVAVPAFDADSAYQYVADQVAFGPRTPGSAAQQRCAVYLAQQMRRWCDTVIIQDFPAILWNGQEVRGKNIIASIEAKGSNPGGRRILLGAHWDSRLWADHDPDEANQHKPIDGANDGASGVAVLIELARAISQQPLDAAVDIIFFDVEDQGTPDWSDDYQEDPWCLGSQYWSRNPHRPYYTALYGILLDMVGTQQPRYTKEEVSRTYAGTLMNKVWNVAASLGYDNIFINSETPSILDDHYYVNRLAGIPMLDIVQNDKDNSFFPYWHTLGDNLSHVDKQSLAVTGQVLLKTLYGDYGAK